MSTLSKISETTWVFLYSSSLAHITKDGIINHFFHYFLGQVKNIIPLLWGTSTLVYVNVRNELLISTTTEKAFPAVAVPFK